MTRYEVSWEVFGTSEIEAESSGDAEEKAIKELVRWRGFGTNLLLTVIEGAEADALQEVDRSTLTLLNTTRIM